MDSEPEADAADVKGKAVTKQTGAKGKRQAATKGPVEKTLPAVPAGSTKQNVKAKAKIPPRAVGKPRLSIGSPKALKGVQTASSKTAPVRPKRTVAAKSRQQVEVVDADSAAGSDSEVRTASEAPSSIASKRPGMHDSCSDD